MIKKLGSCFVVPAFLFGIGATFYADTVSAESAADIQQEINDLNKKKGNIESKKNSISKNKQKTEQKISENLTKQGTVEEQLDALQSKLDATEKKISQKTEEVRKTNEQISKLQQDIEDMTKKIAELQESIQKREEVLKNRLSAIQQNGGQVKYLEVLMGSQDIGDFISRSTSVTTIMDQDKTIMEELNADKKELEKTKKSVEKKKAAVEKKKASLESKKKELETLKATLDSQKADKDKLMKRLEKEHKHLESYKVSLEDEQEILKAQEKAVQEAIALANSKKSQAEEQAKAKQAAQAKSAAAASSPSVSSTPSSGGSGLFSWPAQGTISSGYGHRWGTLHAGLDIANSTGTPVKAAAPGVVISTNTPNDGKMNGYGNVVLIAHSIDGTTYTTLYGHMNSMSVTAGQHVNTGDQIGTIGSTGQSTGPHLHFEVHRGGWNAAKSNSLDPATVLR